MKKALLILLLYTVSGQAQTNKGILLHGIKNGLWTNNGNLGIGTTVPSWGLDIQRTIGAKKDSITHITSTSTNELLTIDTATGQFKRILPSSLGIGGGITSINSQTGSTQTIAQGTGIKVSSSSNTHTISVDTAFATSGTYTPTLTNVSNVGASTAYICGYFVVGNEVHVRGKIDIDPTATGTLLIGVSLPPGWASSFGNDYECAGTVNCGAVENLHGAIRADATNDRAEIQATIPTAGSISNNSWYFEFTYILIGG